MTGTLIFKKHISKQDVLERFPNTLFLFGDNMRRQGYGGQVGETGRRGVIRMTKKIHFEPQKVREPKNYSSLEAEIILARREEGEQMITDRTDFRNNF